jgi:hypothetical protein
MEIHNIKEISNDILNRLNELMNTDCQPGKFSLIDIRDKYSKNTDVLFLFDKENPVYFLLLDLFVKHKTVYIHDVCVNKLHRGKSLFRKSLTFLKDHYVKKGYATFTLDASDSTKEEGLNQKIRIHIFHKAGFDINTETGYFTETGDYTIIKTRVLLDNKEIVEIQKKESDTYIVRNDKGKTYSIKINQIEQCLDAESNQLSCPMIMELGTKGGKRKTIKTRKQSRV